jgi:CRISPR-associated endonuclease/helicase Cas3
VQEEAGQPTAVELDLRLWGKSRGLGEYRYPLVCHLLDAGATARFLWDDYVPVGLKHFIAEGFGVTAEHAGSLIPLWAALHDIGKLTPEFQRLDPSADLSRYPAGRGQRPEHDLAGQKWLQSVLPRLGYATGDQCSPGFSVPQLLGGHHGRFHRGVEGGLSRVRLADCGFRDDAWERQRQATLGTVRRILGSPEPPPDSTPQAAVLACAIVILADWLVSQESHLLSRLPDTPALGTESELSEHFKKSLTVSADLVTGAGLTPLRLRLGSFGESFPHITEPNELQRSIAGGLPGLVRGPGLLLVTAPPGLGKTEAGLFAAKVMGEAAGRPGVYMALPTTATADQIYLRVRRYLESQAEAASPLMLLHGMAWLNTQYTPDKESAPVVTGDGHEGDPFAAADWLRGRWRGMCGSWAVGTIDQALMAVLASRYNALRLFGLAGKTVIVDEVHACDPYMQGLLLKLLRWLGAFGTPVVLLSATLTGRAAAAMVTAYLEGSLGPRRARAIPERSVVPDYPGWLYADGATGEVRNTPIALAATTRLQVSVREVSAPPAQDGGRPVADRGSALRAELAPLARSGGCALVVCTTVDEAQQTFCQLREWFGELAADGVAPPELDLLHARYPAWQREQISGRVMAKYGKNSDGTRPRAAVLVATAIVEQSLDLDFDLIVTDLAPVALLLQRAGRCWRHQALGTIPRPPWASGPQLTVLVPPGGPRAPQLFRSWKAVYDESLLAGTYRLLADREAIAVPGDVQSLVDAVYEDPALVTGMENAVTARLGDEIAQKQLASMAAIKGPHDIDSLVPLTASDVDPELLATRFGADSARALPVFCDADGRSWLDRARTVPLPGQDKAPSLPECRAVIRHTVPVRGGQWLNSHDARAALPEPWHKNIHLRDLVLLKHHHAPDGGFSPAVIGDRQFFLDGALGLRTSRISLFQSSAHLTNLHIPRRSRASCAKLRLAEITAKWWRIPGGYPHLSVRNHEPRRRSLLRTRITPAVAG